MVKKFFFWFCFFEDFDVFYDLSQGSPFLFNCMKVVLVEGLEGDPAVLAKKTHSVTLSLGSQGKDLSPKNF